MEKTLKDTYGPILPYWSKVMSGFAPRKSQLTTFDWIENLSFNTKYMLLEMPVGGGKSPVGLTISAWLSQSNGNSYILTPQKILQRQYENSFNSKILASLYGKANYGCEKKGCSCEVGSTIKPKCDVCPYTQAFEAARFTPNLVLNYKLGLLLFTYTDMSFRKLMVMDECHNLENQLVDLTTFSISEKLAKRIGIPYRGFDHIIEARDWLADQYSVKLNLYMADLSREVDRIQLYSTKPTLAEQEKIKDLIKMSRHADLVNSILLYDRDDLDRSYVLINEEYRFTIKELYGGNAFHSILKPQTEKFLFMSSTILNKDGFCRDLNINPNEAEFLSLESEFDRESRIVMYQPVTKMNYGWDGPDRRHDRIDMITAIMDILNYHENESGIIHTGSFKIASWLVENLVTHKGHEILHHNPDPTGNSRVSRDDVIEEYMAKSQQKPVLLISPSITEGLDLKDDFGRFAIFAKVPYPNLGDAWIKRRMEISGDWYRRQTLKEMIQGAGRICRSEDDWGVTYILDESFTFLYNKTKNNVIPLWWKDGIQT